MKRKKMFTHLILALLQLPLTWPIISAVLADPGPAVTLRAASGATIVFQTQNSETLGGIPPRTRAIPHLVLQRNGVLTDPAERTLVVEVSGIEVPPTGVTVTLELTTQHVDPDQAEGAARIPLWRESRFISNTWTLTRSGATVAFRVEFDGTVPSGVGRTTTPTDYYRYDLVVLDAESADPLHALSQDHAFLMENQWIARLPPVREAASGAAPDELIVYYCDMFPFRSDPGDPATGLPRADVGAYVGGELVPALVQAFRVQSDEWGFTWQHARASDSRETKRLSVALSEGKTWFHGKAPPNGHAGISINVNCGFNATYDTLTDGLLSTFHHELFHNRQRDMAQHDGGHADLSGRKDAWAFFSEGTAVLASSVGQPDVQFQQTSGLRAYMTRANLFLGKGRIVGELNRLNWSYEELSPYTAAVYWRFLYEQCGGMQGGVEDPAAGMQIIRRVLTILYSREVVQIRFSTDLVGNLPEIMDRALAGSSCPFQTYRESLTAFAAAIYALGLEGGRCSEAGTPAGCGLYDPNDLYPVPVSDAIRYTGTTFTYDTPNQPSPAGIPSSYGMDFVEVVLDPVVAGQPLTIEFYGAPGGQAEFNVQVWLLADPVAGGGLSAAVEPGDRASRVHRQSQRVAPGGRLVYGIPAIDLSAYNRLVLLLTRVDAKESADPIGAYTIVLRPDASGGGAPAE